MKREIERRELQETDLPYPGFWSSHCRWYRCSRPPAWWSYPSGSSQRSASWYWLRLKIPIQDRNANTRAPSQQQQINAGEREKGQREKRETKGGRARRGHSFGPNLNPRPKTNLISPGLNQARHRLGTNDFILKAVVVSNPVTSRMKFRFEILHRP